MTGLPPGARLTRPPCRRGRRHHFEPVPGKPGVEKCYACSTRRKLLRVFARQPEGGVVRWVYRQ